MLRTVCPVQQPKIFQLSYGIQGLDIAALDALALTLARYLPKSTVARAVTTGTSLPIKVGGAVVHDQGVSSSVEMQEVQMHSEGVGLAGHEGARPDHSLHWSSRHGAVSGTFHSTPATVARVAGRNSIAANAVSLVVTPSESQGMLIKSSAENNGMVNVTDFVPFMHHRSGNSSGSEDGGGERVIQHEESRDPLDFSDIVPDTQVLLTLFVDIFKSIIHICATIRTRKLLEFCHTPGMHNSF